MARGLTIKSMLRPNTDKKALAKLVVDEINTMDRRIVTNDCIELLIHTVNGKRPADMRAAVHDLRFVAGELCGIKFNDGTGVLRFDIDLAFNEEAEA